MKYRAAIGNLLSYSSDKVAAIENIRDAGYYIVSNFENKYEIYVECDTMESADLIECLNFNI